MVQRLCMLRLGCLLSINRNKWWLQATDDSGLSPAPAAPAKPGAGARRRQRQQRARRHHLGFQGAVLLLQCHLAPKLCCQPLGKSQSAGWRLPDRSSWQEGPQTLGCTAARRVPTALQAFVADRGLVGGQPAREERDLLWMLRSALPERAPWPACH